MPPFIGYGLKNNKKDIRNEYGKLFILGNGVQKQSYKPTKRLKIYSGIWISLRLLVIIRRVCIIVIRLRFCVVVV